MTNVRDPKSDTARYIERLRRLVQVLIDNNPHEDAADGVTVLEVWRKEAREILSEARETP